MRRIVFASLVFLIPYGGLGMAGPAPSAKAPTEVEKAVRARIEKFYGYFKDAKFRQAERLVAEEDRDAYYTATKTRILDFEIQSLSVDEEQNTAHAVILCEMVSPSLGEAAGSARLKMPLTSRWKLIDDEWYFYFPLSEQMKAEEGHKTPAGTMRFSRNPGTRRPVGSPTRMPDLAGMFQVDREVLEFQSDSTSSVTETVRFINPGPARLSLVRLTTDIASIEVDVEPEAEQIEPNEEILISFTYRPEVEQLKGEYRYSFRVEPIMQGFTVRLRFQK